MDIWQQAYLKAMGIDIWVSRDAVALVDDVTPHPVTITQPLSETAAMPVELDDLSVLDWSALQAKVAACTRCELHSGRTQTVFGVGNQQADLLIIGEAPGQEEDQQGSPFVGQSGQLLSAMLKAINFSRQDVYITNILKCHPVDDLKPSAQHTAQCRPYLERQITLLQPKLILAVGRIAAHALLQTETKLGELRSQLHHYAATQTPLIVTYHPAYLLRSPLAKAKAWQDLLFVQRTLGDRHKAD